LPLTNTKANSSACFPSENIFSYFNSRIQLIFASIEANDQFPIGCSEEQD